MLTGLVQQEHVLVASQTLALLVVQGAVFDAFDDGSALEPRLVQIVQMLAFCALVLLCVVLFTVVYVEIDAFDTFVRVDVKIRRTREALDSGIGGSLTGSRGLGRRALIGRQF